MFRKLSNEKREVIDFNCFKNELLDEEMFLFSNVEIDLGSKGRYERKIYNHSINLDELKDVYQNLVLIRFIEGINYNPNISSDGLDLFELIKLKKNDFRFNLEEEGYFKEFLEIIKSEPNSFEELKEYIFKTSKLLNLCGSRCEASLHIDFLDAFDRMLLDYDDVVPAYEERIEYVKDSSSLFNEID